MSYRSINAWFYATVLVGIALLIGRCALSYWPTRTIEFRVEGPADFRVKKVGDLSIDLPLPANINATTSSISEDRDDHFLIEVSNGKVSFHARTSMFLGGFKIVPFMMLDSVFSVDGSLWIRGHNYALFWPPKPEHFAVIDGFNVAHSRPAEIANALMNNRTTPPILFPERAGYSFQAEEHRVRIEASAGIIVYIVKTRPINGNKFIGVALLGGTIPPNNFRLSDSHQAWDERTREDSYSGYSIHMLLEGVAGHTASIKIEGAINRGIKCQLCMKVVVVMPSD